MAMMIKEIESQAKEENTSGANNIIALAIQRRRRSRGGNNRIG